MKKNRWRLPLRFPEIHIYSAALRTNAFFDHPYGQWHSLSPTHPSQIIIQILNADLLRSLVSVVTSEFKEYPHKLGHSYLLAFSAPKNLHRKMATIVYIAK